MRSAPRFDIQEGYYEHYLAECFKLCLKNDMILMTKYRNFLN